MTRTTRSQKILADADSRILVIDGAMGTAFQGMNLTAEDFGGRELEGCNENLILTRPDLVYKVHDTYLKSGCDIVETNTFGATPMVLAEYGLSELAYEINKKGAEIARRACAANETQERPRYVAGSIGPTTKAISVTGGVTFQELVENFYIQAKGLLDGGADYFLIETSQDTRNIKACLIALDRLFEETGEEIPVAVSGTIETSGTMLGGQTVEALIASLENRKLFYLGLNCATGPEFMTDHIRTLAKLSPFRVACVPNAGLPDEEGHYLESPEMMCRVLKLFMDEGWINLVGGCCGTHAGHIHAMSDLTKGKTPRKVSNAKRSSLSGVDYLEVTDELRPVIVGERTNVIGSKKFKELIVAEKFDDAAEIAKIQVKAGAQIIDVCLANPDRDEKHDLIRFLEKVIQKIRVPLMIDSTDDSIFEEALTYCQGKAILNSINFEDGEERFHKVVPLAKKFGAAVVVGTIDEDPNQGMAVTRERKLAIAERAANFLHETFAFPIEDVYFDPLVFPCATGDEQYIGSAAETIEGIRLIKQRFPTCKTVLGVSNVSFGLPAAGREVLNSVFLYHCVKAGLDLAIVNSEKLERFSSISPDEVELAENLLFNRGEDPIAKFAAQFRDRKAKAKRDRSEIPLDERLSLAVIEGSKDGLIEDLEEARKTRAPLEIINGPLMNGMDEVGRLFGANKLIVAEVLQSAEVMKAAVSYLERYMEKSDTAARGKILLATVKGDVHDIGKNLVDIILSNNGFKVVNLGIKIPPEQLIQAAREHKPDMIGLSGLLVKSAQQMVTTAEDLSRSGITVPMLVGGAALSRNFTEKKILTAYGGTVLYASDAMNGLELANKVMDKAGFPSLQEEMETKKQLHRAARATETGSPAPISPDLLYQRAASVPAAEQIPQPMDYARHVERQTSIEVIWRYVNPLMLFTRHLGVSGRSAKLLDRAAREPQILRTLKDEDPKALEIWEAVESLKLEFLKSETLAPSAVYRFFPAVAEKNSILLFDSVHAVKPLARFDFDRQTTGERLCLADYVSTERSAGDSLALFVTSVGRGVRHEALRLKESGEFLKSHILQALAIESAEAYAEFLHSQIRRAWGFADPPSLTMPDRFQAKYRGKRYSFGYPACPKLEDQAPLFDLLKPGEIGVELTEGFMMDPEASVSALVFHHPSAKYFGV